jgi:DUF4097 and DUF4098 domain-containing protein YvlB
VGKSEYDLERAINVRGQARLTVRGDADDVHIRAWDDPVIRVRAEGGEPSITATESAVSIERGRGHGDIEYDIRVPKTCTVEVRQATGDVTLEGTSGEVNVQSHEGDVTLLSIDGTCRVRTASGDLSAERIRGRLIANTASGEVTVEESALSGFEVETVSGDAEIETSLADGGHYIFRTVSGSLELGIPKDAGATVVLRTQQGDVECDLPAQVTNASRTRWEGTINGGGARIEVQSVTGDLEISGSDSLPAQATRELPPAAEYDSPAGADSEASPNRDSASILDMLARGEIDVDEAMAELDRIEA